MLATVAVNADAHQARVRAAFECRERDDVAVANVTLFRGSAEALKWPCDGTGVGRFSRARLGVCLGRSGLLLFLFLATMGA